MEAAGQVPSVWGAAFVFGNLFALVWAAVAVFQVHPEFSYRLKQCWRRVRSLIRAGLSRHQHSSHLDSSRMQEAANPAAQVAISADTERHPSSSVEAIIWVAAETQPGHLAWQGLGLIARSKSVLQGVYGSAAPGQLHAVVGPSGCGKSVFLELLAMRLGQPDSQPTHTAARTRSASHRLEAPRRRVCGQVLVNGQDMSRQEYLDVSAYMPESDTLVPVMTACEMVSFHTSVTLPHLAPPTQRARAEAVLAMLGLEQQHDTLVGGVLPAGMTVRGLSGGERKRCAIACAVVSLPRIILLDGPLSGLDSSAALSVIRYLDSIAREQHAAVVFSLHQPRAAIWSQIDQVTLLASGRMLYTGITDNLAPWLQSLGFDYDPETQGIVPDWALDLVSLGFNSIGSESSQMQQTPPGSIGAIKHVDLVARATGSGQIGISLCAAADAFLCHLKSQQPELFHAGAEVKSAMAGAKEFKVQLTAAGGGKDATYQPQLTAAAAATAGELASATAAPDDIQPEGFQMQPHSTTCSKSCTATGFQKYRSLLWREALLTTRNPSNIAGRMVVYTYVSLVFGIVFYDVGAAANSILVRMAVIHIELLFLLMINLTIMPFFYDDKRYLLQDVSKGLYRPLQYFLARASVAVPFGLVMAVVFHLVFYGMAGMRHGATYMLQSGVIAVLVSMIGMQMVNICTTAASSQDLASALVCGWMAVNMFITPFHNRFEAYTLGWGMSWLRYFSPINWAWQGSVAVELGGRYFDCSNGSGLPALGIMPQLLPSTTPILRLVHQQVDHLGPGCIASGDAVIRMYTQCLTYKAIVGILLGYYTLALLAAYLVAVWKCRKAAGA